MKNEYSSESSQGSPSPPLAIYNTQYILVDIYHGLYVWHNIRTILRVVYAVLGFHETDCHGFHGIAM